MNREILFRGKRVDNGEWIEGNGINQQIDVAGNKHAYIALPIKSRAYPPMTTVEWVEVIPETVGQYTGLMDKNGKKIFEGDIVKYNNTVYEIAYITKYARFAGRKPETIMSIFPLEDSEVIGNIHDNPELLEG